jgi:hypothetical protein
VRPKCRHSRVCVDTKKGSPQRSQTGVDAVTLKLRTKRGTFPAGSVGLFSRKPVFTALSLGVHCMTDDQSFTELRGVSGAKSRVSERGTY